MDRPQGKGSRSLKRKANAHAARVTHARARRLRTANYMSEKGVHKTDKDFSTDGWRRIAQPSVVHPFAATPSVPKTIPGAFEHEPLAGFLKSLSSREHFLFDHCM